MANLLISVEKMDREVRLPIFATKGAAAADVYAFNDKPLTIGINERMWLPTGIKMAIPEGWAAQMCSRSGLASQGVVIGNPAGLIDSDYRGEIKVLLANYGDRPFVVNRYDRIAQMLFIMTEQPDFIEVSNLDETERGDKGFGSTGGYENE